MVFHTEKNFIKTVKIEPMKPRPAACVDIKGYKQVLETSGLVPKYIKKKVFLFPIKNVSFSLYGAE